MESNEARFTHNELVQILLEAQSDNLEDNGVMTGPELAEALDMTEYSTLRRVKVLIKAGTLEVAKKRIMNMLGIETSVYGYRLKV